jgi:hypothetical protein
MNAVKTHFSMACGLARFGLGLKKFLRVPVSVDEAKSIIRQRILMRDHAFLKVVERAVFNNKRSPYLKLFRAADCELGDVRTLVSKEGIEGTLRELFKAGIYVDFDEFKGQKPVIRGGKTFQFCDSDFDNPLILPHYQTTSGGSSGIPTRIMIDLEYLADRTPVWSMMFEAHHLLSSPLVFLTPYYPGIVNLHLIYAKLGNRFIRWFATASGGSMAYKIVSAYLHTLLRWTGGFPKPEFIRPGDWSRVGDCLVGMVRSGLRPCVNASPSDAIRVCLAMRERGISLHHVTFLLGYEPLTPARRKTIEEAGAMATMTYGFSEAGTVGLQCPQPGEVDDVHVASDAFAVIPYDRRGDEGDTFKALLLTTLGASTPKVMLNTEIGDYAVLDSRKCGCLFDEFGYHQHLHTIRSFGKLTGGGVTFLATDLYRLIEEMLPQRFGGNLGDYQLVEEQDAQGLPRLSLFASPELKDIDERELVAVFLAEVGKIRRQYPFMVNQWIESYVLRVVRKKPLLTKRGKLLPLRKLGS